MINISIICDKIDEKVREMREFCVKIDNTPTILP